MSRVIPTDRGKQRAAVANQLRSEGDRCESSTTFNAVTTSLASEVNFSSSSSQSGATSGLASEKLVPSSSTSPSLPVTSGTTSDTERDPHNEVERRRKLRISQNIKTLAATLGSPCHCGKSTRAEVLEMVVKRIKELQQKNTELESTLKELPSPETNEEKLSQQIAQLVEENLRLRAVLLASDECKKLASESPTCSNQSRDELEPAESADNDIDTGKNEDQNQVDDQTIEEVHELPSVGDEKEAEGDGVSIDDGNKGKGDSRDEGSIRECTSSHEGAVEPEKETEAERNENVGKEVRDSNQVGEEMELDQSVDRETGTVTSSAGDQSWPMSSLLSSQSRSVAAGHQGTAHGLPILSPSYIAEQCSSTSGAYEQHFFGPTTSLLTPSAFCGSENNPRFDSPNTLVSATIQKHVDIGGASRQWLSHTTPTSSSVAQPLQSRAEMSRSHSPRRQSIVQPWIGSSGHHRHRSSPVTANKPCRNVLDPSSGAPVTVSQHHHPLALPPGARSAYPNRACFQQSTRNDSNEFRLGTTSIGHTRGHGTRNHQSYTRNSEHNNRIDSALVGSVSVSAYPQGYSAHPSNHSRAQSSNFATVSSSASFWNWSRHIQSVSSSTSTGDPYYGSFPSQAVYPSQQAFIPQPHGHAPQGTHFSPNHHQHQAYPPPPPPLPAPPSFPFSHHQHTPSQHHDVWRPYSDRRRTSTSFHLSNILSPSPTLLPSHGLQTGIPPPPPAAIHQQGRVPSFFVDHILDDL